MAFIFTCGTHTFSSLLPGYEHVTAQCQNCGNWSAKVLKRWEWFTFCFVPIIPFSLKPWHEAQMNGQGGQQIPMQGGPQGWNQGQQPQIYQQQQHPQQYHQEPPQGGMTYK